LLFLITVGAQSVAQGALPRVGLLRQAYPTDAFTAAFLDEMRLLGYVEGQTVVYEARWAEGSPDRVPDLARDLGERNLDVIVTGGDNAILAAKQAAPQTPIVMAASNDPVGAGLVESLARPGGTVTGLTIFSQELSQKRLEVFREAVPGLSRVAVLRNPNFPSSEIDLASTEAAARILGLSLQVIDVVDSEVLEVALAGSKQQGVDGLITLADPFFTARKERIAELTRAMRLPAMFYWREFAEAGGLISYGPDGVALYRRAAHYVHRILKGAKPAELPVEQPTKLELVLNAKTARALGLSFPPTLHARADEVIE
jgi:putative ABC transport system substrate-binding protein